MNHRGGLALIRGTWASWLQYRSFFFLLAFGWMVPPLIYMLVWSAAAGETGQVGGLGRGQFVTYYLVLILVNQLTYSQTNWTVGDLIRAGEMNRILLRPLAPIYDTLASEAAGKIVYMAFLLPIVALLGLILRPELQLETFNLLAFLPALLFAWALRFFWGYWLALLAFWATRADALLAVQDALIFLLAGQVAPTALLPGPLHTTAVILPFRYMLGFPVEVLTGQLTQSEIGFGLAIQAGWLLLALALSAVIWRSGLRRYSAIGG
ncbi:MAG: ABC-2 family transporter protein [Anaerolineales bacterium]|nr:ABC-2 family transporter protein [Anaerolineales bacterium]